MRIFFQLAPLALVALSLPLLAQDRGDRQFNSDQAVQTCKDSIQQEAHERFGAAAVNFRQTTVDNNPGRKDWVVGTIAVKTSRWRPSEVYRFSCSVDFSTGRVRSAHIGVPNY